MALKLFFYVNFPTHVLHMHAYWLVDLVIDTADLLLSVSG